MVALAIVVTAIVVLVIGDYTGGIRPHVGTLIVSLVASLTLALVIAGSALRSYRGRGSRALSHAAIWLAICAGLAALYMWKQPIAEALGFA
jgi:hypothetical protein